MKFERGSEEFNRVLNFSDAIFAIAMTLLIVGVEVPPVNSPDSIGDLADALNRISESFIAFFISFAVIGRYWWAHHQAVSYLKGFGSGWIGINLVYLAFIAFLPFPTDLLGEYFDNPLAVSVYAINVALISSLEAVMLHRAYSQDLLRVRPSPEAFRWAMIGSLQPVAALLVSIPVAFAVGSTAAVICWLAALPLGMFWNRFKPSDVDEVFS